MEESPEVTVEESDFKCREVLLQDRIKSESGSKSIIIKLVNVRVN